MSDQKTEIEVIHEKLTRLHERIVKLETKTKDALKRTFGHGALIDKLFE